MDTRNAAYDLYYTNRPVSGGTWSVPEKVNSGSGQVWSPVLVADASGNVYAAWRDSRDTVGNHENDTYIYASKRMVGTGTWGPNVRITDSVFQKDRTSPALALHNDHTLHFTWADFRQGNSDVYHEKIAANDPIWNTGGEWSQSNNQRVNPDDDGIDQVDPAIAIDSFGNVYVAWADERNATDNDSNWDIYVSKLPVGKDTWTGIVPQRLNDDATIHPQGQPTLAADDCGNVLVAWMDGRDLLTPPHQWSIYTARLSPGPLNWSTNSRASDDVASPSREWPVLAVTPGGHANLIWRDFRDDATPHLYATTSMAPALLHSSKSVNLTSVEPGDTLTYTFSLRNNRSTTVTATLTDSIPAHTTYITGSAWASDGGPVTVAGGQLHWSGRVISNTPTIVAFAVEAQEAAAGTVITNVAQLDDGQGYVIELGTSSTYNSGYWLTINDGALYTSIPTVTLKYGWNMADNITAVRFSNDGGFGPAGHTTDWISVNPADPTHTDWVLDTYGNLILQRTVFVKFRDTTGHQYGPFQDGIIYDPNPPQVTHIEIIAQPTQAVSVMAEQNVTVQVTASDDNSGVDSVQLSHTADFEQFAEFTVTGGTTDISWMLQPSGKVHVRVMDRAGNFSSVSNGQGMANHTIYLPLILRSY
ncbi:MAG: DUF11 domain-containing protein [Chloroflexi bacterium]|nr:DUF11 domain-containing protein [Chloroflexota bacterium]